MAGACPSAMSMGTPLCVIMVHGYGGKPADLSRLEARLADDQPALLVDNLCLPGHGEGDFPPFDEAVFLDAIAAHIDRRLQQGHRLVLLGHSMGGSLLLAEIERRLTAAPHNLDALLLLVLCATPPHIDLGYAERWARHTVAQPQQIALDDLVPMIALVNRLARRRPLPVPAPVLIVHGEGDELVPVTAAELWRTGRLLAPQRHVRIAGATHHLLGEHGSELAVDVICRAIDDARNRIPDATATNAHRTLFELMPGLQAFTDTWPDSLPHLANSPAGQRAVDRPVQLGGKATSEPTLANIEITTRCNLGCAACARTQLKLQSRFMSREDFRSVLAHLPHAWRIVLVGLGEPLLHPELIDFIRLAVAEGRRVGLVTNGMLLDADWSRELCASGLAAITLSIDAVTTEIADRVRKGSDMQLISANIRQLIDERRHQGVKLGTSVFTALCQETIDEFSAIVDFVADHKLDALMVTDLNLPSNQARSLHRTISREQTASLRRALKKAVRHHLPVLSVWGLEEFALDSRYPDYLLLRGDQLTLRSGKHTHCASPWQTIPVNVDGDLTLCDCQPEAVIGNIHQTPLAAWWNGQTMMGHRQSMLSKNPPAACLICPRF